MDIRKKIRELIEATDRERIQSEVQGEVSDTYHATRMEGRIEAYTIVVTMLDEEAERTGQVLSRLMAVLEEESREGDVEGARRRVRVKRAARRGDWDALRKELES